MNKFNMYAGTIYQFIILIAVIVFNGYFIFIKGELNEILIGAILGMMVTLPFKDNPETKVDTPKEKVLE